MTNKEKENVLKSYVIRYKKSLSQCMNDPTSISSDEPLLFDPSFESRELLLASRKETNDPRKYLYRVNFALSCMERRKAILLWKEFFFQVEKFWWMRYYTRSTFYRIRKMAVEEFLCLME